MLNAGPDPVRALDSAASSHRSPNRPTDDADALTLGSACRIALMGVVFALVLSLALSPTADARQTDPVRIRAAAGAPGR